MSFTESLDDIVASNRNGLLGAHPSWSRVRLSEAFSILNGYPFPSSQFGPEGGVPLIRIRDIVRGRSDTHFVGEYDPQYLVRHGELIVGMDGDFNCALWGGQDALLNQRVCKLTAKGDTYSLRLLAYALPGYLDAINAHTSAITVKHLSSRTLADIPLPTPPRSEQDELVATIESHFSRLDAAVATLERVQQNLKRYRASVLKAAVEGRLVPTEAELARAEGREYEPAAALLERILVERRRRWEEAELAKMKASGKVPKDDKWKVKYKEPVQPDTEGLPELPEGWCWASLDAIAEVRLGKMLSAKVRETHLEQRPYLRNQNVRWGHVDLSDLNWMGFKQDELERFAVKPGDLLVCEGGVPGRSAVLQAHNVPNLMYQKALHRIRTYGGLASHPLLQLCLEHFAVAGTILPRASETTIKHLPLEEMVSLPFPMPPEAEQARILEGVAGLLPTNDRLAVTLRNETVRVSRLRQSILKWAFEGRLIDQASTNEPTTALDAGRP